MVSNSNDIPANAEFLLLRHQSGWQHGAFSQVSVALEKAGVAFERLSAFDGRKLALDTVADYVPRLPDAMWAVSWSVAKSAAIIVI